jgi:hypothetical protein
MRRSGRRAPRRGGSARSASPPRLPRTRPDAPRNDLRRAPLGPFRRTPERPPKWPPGVPRGVSTQLREQLVVPCGSSGATNPPDGTGRWRSAGIAQRTSRPSGTRAFATSGRFRGVHGAGPSPTAPCRRATPLSSGRVAPILVLAPQPLGTAAAARLTLADPATADVPDVGVLRRLSLVLARLSSRSRNGHGVPTPVLPWWSGTVTSGGTRATDAPNRRDTRHESPRGHRHGHARRAGTDATARGAAS